MSKLYDVAIVGGHGLVATRIAEDLHAVDFPLNKLVIYGSAKNKEVPLAINGRIHEVHVLDTGNIPHFDVVFFSGSEDLANLYAEYFIAKGAKVIDNSSSFRMDDKVPLVIPEINPYDLLNQSFIYANPNCSTIMMLLALAPLDDYFHLERINVSTYQAASGMGKFALANFLKEQKDEGHLSGLFPSKNSRKKALADNILPVIGDVTDQDDYSGEEIKMRLESQKIMHDPELEVSATCVRVPTTIGHAASIQAIFKDKIDMETARKLLRECPWITLKDGDDYPDLLEVRHTNQVHVGRLRLDKDCEYTMHMFTTSDNLHRGASYNAVLIAKKLVELGII